MTFDKSQSTINTITIMILERVKNNGAGGAAYHHHNQTSYYAKQDSNRLISLQHSSGLH